MKNIKTVIISAGILFAVTGCTSSGTDFFSSLWNDVIAPGEPSSAQVADQLRTPSPALAAGLGDVPDAEAAVRGDASMQHRLGYAYATGEGVRPDLVAAYAWLNLAAVNMAPGAEHDLAVANREVVARQMDPAEIAEAHRLTSEWAALGRQTPERTAGGITVEVEFQELGFLQNLDRFSDRS